MYSIKGFKSTVFAKEVFMPRDKSENHEKIVDAAYEEFMTYGFVDASMRRIASNCQMSASGLYKHFSSKEDMFDSLVVPAYNGLKEKYNQILDKEYADIKNKTAEDIWEGDEETVWVTKYIYDNYNAFKLLVCKSQGTAYENFIHELASMEEKATIEYIEKLKENGIKTNPIPKKELHLFVTSNINAIFETVVHDFSKKEAIAYAKRLDEYCVAGWKRIFGLAE